MKIRLASTLPLTPVQLDPRHASPRRVVGELHGVQHGRDFKTPVYEFRHDDNDRIEYKVDPLEKIWTDSLAPVSGSCHDRSGMEARTASDLIWLEHDESVNYKPYAFVVMDAMTRLAAAWDGVVYRSPHGELLRESAFQASLQIVDACVSSKDGLWIMVSISGESSTGSSINSSAVHQLGWVPVG